jgi:GNAT superfamily N-acetyltransferase
MIFRSARPEDRDQLQSFNLGTEVSLWLSEVREIVRDLLEWRDNIDCTDLDRQVDVIEADGEIIAVAGHERIVHERFGVQLTHRYLMVTAVRWDHQRQALAQTLIESIFAEQASMGVETFRWLVHPRNAPSLAFNAKTFPEADTTQPPEDAPYIVFTLTINGAKSEAS